MVAVDDYKIHMILIIVEFYALISRVVVQPNRVNDTDMG